jgi:NAD(P)-dependent dehydrogenase (short-subunit alcohol dehydrogenase family)
MGSTANGAIMELEGKTALIFGAGGQVGTQVAKAFAREGARLFLSGPRTQSIERLAAELRSGGARAEVAAVDATDDDAVSRHVDAVAQAAGRIDIVFNAMGVRGDEVVAPSTEVSREQFMTYLEQVVPSQFLTARAAARHMLRQRSGAIVLLGATPARGVAPFIAGAAAAHAAIEGLALSLATEWSPMGVRVVCYRSAGMADSRRIQGVLDAMARIVGVPRDAFIQAARDKPLLKRMSTLAEAAEAISFLASDRASVFTGTVVNGCCGEVVD